MNARETRTRPAGSSICITTCATTRRVGVAAVIFAPSTKQIDRRPARHRAYRKIHANYIVRVNTFPCRSLELRFDAENRGSGRAGTEETECEMRDRRASRVRMKKVASGRQLVKRITGRNRNTETKGNASGR